jgi:hypothetical protein
VGPGGLGRALAAPLQPQPAVQVVHQRGGQQREQDGREHEAEHHADERVVEDEERYVQLELLILDPERGAVGEKQPGAPVAGGG